MIEKIFRPGPRPNSVINEYDIIIAVPEGWSLLPPGDAGLTRRVKAAGEYWVVQEKKGRRIFSKGIWTATNTIEKTRLELEAERSTESYSKRKESAATSQPQTSLQLCIGIRWSLSSPKALRQSHRCVHFTKYGDWRVMEWAL